MYKIEIPLHFGETLQYTNGAGNIVISNVLKDPNVDINCIENIYKQERLTDNKLLDYLMRMPFGQWSIESKIKNAESNEKSEPPNFLIAKAIALLNEVKPIREELQYESNSKCIMGKGMGSSTADIIGLSKLYYQYLDIDEFNLDIRWVLSLSETASDPLYLKRPVVYNSVTRSVLAILPERGLTLILGYDPFDGKKKVSTSSLVHNNNEKYLVNDLKKYVNGISCKIHRDSFVANLATKSIMLNSRYMHHKIPDIFRELDKIPGVGITGSHSGVMIGLLITELGLIKMASHPDINSYISRLNDLNLKIYSAI